MNTQRSLWAYVSGVAALAAAAYPVLIAEYGPYEAREWAAAFILFLATPAAESLVVHFRLRKSAHSFSLLELPLTAGLLTTAPLLLVLAYGTGNLLVLVFRRRQPPLKLVFNTATFVLTATLALFLFRLFPHSGSTYSPVTWVSAAVSVFAASMLGTALVVGVIAVAERKFDRGSLGTSLAWGLATASGGISLGLAAAMLSSQSPVAVVFITAPLLALYAANRAYESEHQRRESLQVVFDTSRTLTETVESEEALFNVLDRCLSSMASDFAAIFVEQDPETFIALAVDERGQHRSVVPATTIAGLLQLADRRGAAWSLAGEARRASADANRVADELAVVWTATGRRGAVEAFVAPLQDDTRTRGVVVVSSDGGSMMHLDDDQFALFETICRSVSSHTRLSREAQEDSLTGLPNRRRLMQRLESAFSSGNPESLILLLFDLDDFKGINDTFGHAFGDGVLVEVGRRLQRIAPESWLAARLGGDEFAIVGAASGDRDGLAIGSAALIALKQPIQIDGQVFQVRGSVGLCRGTAATTPAELLRNADTALYEAKRFDKGHLVEFTKPMHERAARRYRLGEALREALNADALSVVIQPIVDLESRSVTGGEFLSRWTHPEFGQVSPEEFVRVAEDENLSLQLGTHVLTALVRSVSGLPGSMTFSINVSPGDLMDAKFVDLLTESARSLRPHLLGVEVTERMLASDPNIQVSLGALRGSGIRVYVDDFGTGYSSLAYLKDLPADFLKIPREFVRDMEGNERAQAVVKGIVELAKALGLGTVAEGVETPMQCRLVAAAGAGFGQGYLFAKPMTVGQFGDRLLSPSGLAA